MKFTKELMLKHLEDFKSLYENRPIKDNAGGMNSAHMFPLYVYLKTYPPKMIIESGIWKGQGTWLMEQCVDAKIYSIDISLNQLVYKSDNVTYFNKDITTHDWGEMLNQHDISPDEVLVFLDDHQNFNERIDFLLGYNLTKIIAEDNYPSDQGDCISPKKILTDTDFVLDKGGNISTHSIEPYLKFRDNIKEYEEFPPIFKSVLTRWGTPWVDYVTPEPILEESDRKNHDIFYHEKSNYTWIAYVELKNK